MKILISITLFVLNSAFSEASTLFSLKDSDPSGEVFKKQFLASYGVNGAIEPKVDPEDREIYEAALPYLENDPLEAIRQVESKLPEEPVKPAFQLLLGNLYYQLERYDSSEKALKKAVAAFPSFRRAYRTLGIIFIQSERFADSVEAFRTVIKLGGADSQSYGLLAYSHLNLENYASALNAYQMARMFDPESEDFRRGQAHCMVSLEMNQQALGLLNEMIKEKPDNTDYRMMQANLLLKLSRFEEAIASLEIIRIMGSIDLNGIQLLGDLYLQEYLPELALEIYTVALSKTTNFEKTDSWIRPIRIFLTRNYLPEAQQYLSSIENTLPQGALSEHREVIDLVKANVALESGESKAAITLLQPLIKSNPMQGEALILVGKAFIKEENYEQAAFYLERATSIPDFRYTALVSLGRLYVGQGNARKALSYYSKAYQIRADVSLANYIKRLKSFIK